MDQIKALYKSTGTSIMATIQPTLEIYSPLLLKNIDAILAVPIRTESYGAHPRQKLDIYFPTQKSEGSPILVFFYGGGLILGDKILPHVPEGLQYHNLGTFFANRGITTIIPDYRRVNSEFGGEDAMFPSGGEDVSLVMKWLETFSKKGKGDTFIMGNSAGGVHLSTFLFAPQFLQQRKSLVSGDKGITFKGAIELSVPFHFKTADSGRLDTLTHYYGSEQDMAEKCPYGLLEAVAQTGKSRQEAFVPDILLVLGEFDPVDEIGQSMHDFMELGTKTWETGLEFWHLKGHNHLSPPPALMSGEIEGEKWGEDVTAWIKKLSI